MRRRNNWPFWKVVLAGWIIRYPKVVFVPIGFVLVLIYNIAVSN
tara:strand:+ start:343 stop:474 length:132 start_codon:yes stop_codon:yes gene_type:complete